MSRILMILTSHDQLGDTGKKTGFWLEEFASPYYVFRDAGHDVTLASPKGGQPPIDPTSSQPQMQTDATRRFNDDEQAKAAMAATVPLSQVDVTEFDAVFYPGGHGPLWDLANDSTSQQIILDSDAAGRPLGLVCHAPRCAAHPHQGGRNIVRRWTIGGRVLQQRGGGRRPDRRRSVPR